MKIETPTIRKELLPKTERKQTNKNKNKQTRCDKTKMENRRRKP